MSVLISFLLEQEELEGARMEIVELRSTIDSLHEENRTYREHVDQYKSISQAAENALSELNAAYDQFREAAERRSADYEEEVRKQCRRVEILESDLQRTLAEHTTLQETYDADVSAREREKQEMLQELARLREAEATVEAREGRLREEIRNQASLTAEAQSNYERELVLHATDVQALKTLKEELSNYEQRLREQARLADMAASELQSSRLSWEEQKSSLQRSLEEVELRSKELEHQNSILHSHFELLSSQAAKLQRVDASSLSPLRRKVDYEISSVESEGQHASPADSDDLRQVIRFLRREKDILECQHELLQQENRRYKQQAEMAQKALDETRALLSEVCLRSGTHRSSYEYLLTKIVGTCPEPGLCTDAGAAPRIT